MPQNSSDSNIFSTNVISSDNISTLEADKPAKKVMKDCMIFFD